MINFDYDMAVVVIAQSLSPGNEQREFFGSAAADQPGSQNQLGIKNKAADALIEQLIASPTRVDLVNHVHALDRVLLYGYYLIPQYHLGATWVAYWNKFHHPQVAPKYALGLETWWVDQAPSRRSRRKRRKRQRNDRPRHREARSR